jgi:hypothetical protein
MYNHRLARMTNINHRLTQIHIIMVNIIIPQHMYRMETRGTCRNTVILWVITGGLRSDGLRWQINKVRKHEYYSKTSYQGTLMYCKTCA